MAEGLGARGVHPDCINASNPFHECTDYCFKRISKTKSAEGLGARDVHPDCINVSNPFHECTDYCFKRISETKSAEGLGARGVHPDCINVSNPFHECTDYCFKRILKTESAEGLGARDVHPNCINVSNPFHECTDYCFKRIAKTKSEQAELRDENSAVAATDPSPTTSPPVVRENGAQSAEIDRAEEEAEKERRRVAYTKINTKQEKLFDLELKPNDARKANQQAIAAEMKREDAPEEVRGVSKKNWLEDLQRRLGKGLGANGQSEHARHSGTSLQGWDHNSNENAV